MVDGMGLCGFEGVYRRVMETCMSVLRTNRETLLSVLEPFLQASIVAAERFATFRRVVFLFLSFLPEKGK